MIGTCILIGFFMMSRLTPDLWMQLLIGGMAGFELTYLIAKLYVSSLERTLLKQVVDQLAEHNKHNTRTGAALTEILDHRHSLRQETLDRIHRLQLLQAISEGGEQQ